MKKSFAVLLVTGALFVLPATAALAGGNQGAQAYLSWSATDTTLTDTATIGTNVSLYVILYRAAELKFKGADVEIIWNPAGDGAGCFDRVGHFFKTSAGTVCTYLNRGSAAGIIVADDPNHFYVAWANNSTLTGCTLGAIIQIQYDNSTCTDLTGCFKLTYVKTVDDQSVEDVIQIASPYATMNGGGGHCVPVPVRPSSWGKIKELYRK